jgi:uracil-DNA glycosylase
MADDAARKELLSLTEAIGAQLEYLNELGVAHIAAHDGEAQTDEPQPLPPLPSFAREPDAQHSSALQRNAAAEVRRKQEAERAARARTEPPPQSQGHNAPPRPHDGAATSEQVEMATRKSATQPTNAQTPATMNTLFGEIAPQDELSLPRPGETLEDVWRDIGPQCMRCTLCCEGRKQVVNSEGNPRARLMFVGEAPGADEDAQARPFVGRAGQLLNKIIEAIGMKREDVFIGNVNRCRPANNRTPTAAEAAVCKPFLLREIAIMRPDVIVVLGNTAMKNLLDTKEGITKVRGQFQDYKGIKVMPTFHPAYLLRDPSKKRETWDDMKKVRDYISTLKGKAEE